VGIAGVRGGGVVCKADIFNIIIVIYKTKKSLLIVLQLYKFED
jgi:hypothetical protein